MLRCKIEIFNLGRWQPVQGEVASFVASSGVVGSFGNLLDIIFDLGCKKTNCCEYSPGGEKWTCKIGGPKGWNFLF